jgi:hypothetical protein
VLLMRRRPAKGVFGGLGRFPAAGLSGGCLRAFAAAAVLSTAWLLKPGSSFSLVRLQSKQGSPSRADSSNVQDAQHFLNIWIISERPSRLVQARTGRKSHARV